MSRTIREIAAVVRRRWWTLLIVPVLVTGTAASLSGLRPRLYRSSAEVLVTPLEAALPGSPSATPAATPVNMATEASIASSEDVVAAAATRLGMQPGRDDLLGGLSVTPDENNARVLTVDYTSSNPQEAQRRAQAFADGYLEVRRKVAADDLAAQVRAAQGRSVALTAPQATTLPVGQILLPADLPMRPIQPNRMRNVSVAVVVGLVLGTGTAFLRERLDDRAGGIPPRR